MIIKDDRYMVISDRSNNIAAAMKGLLHWDEGLYPNWAAINAFHLFPQSEGNGVEPHYHDNDEFWLFTAGRGEIWLDGNSSQSTPNTVMYTPMGTMQRFQMFTDGEMVALATRLEREQRAGHLLVEADGSPVPTVTGFVVPGSDNTCPFPERGSRCPLSELRMVVLEAGATVEEARLAANEYWLVLSGVVSLLVGELDIELARGDLAVLRSGLVCILRCVQEARVALARE